MPMIVAMLANTHQNGIDLLTQMADAAAAKADDRLPHSLCLSACDALELGAGAASTDLRLESWIVRETVEAITISVFAIAPLPDGERLAARGRFTFNTLTPR